MAETQAAPIQESEIGEQEAPAASAVDDAPETKEAEAVKPVHKPRRSAEKRIDQLTAQLREAQRQLTKPVQEETPAKEPKREDFGDYEDYLDARSEHRASRAAEKVIADARTAQRQEAESAQATAQERSFISAREAALERGIEAHEDFEAVTTNPDLEITPAMADALLSNEKGHEVWYHLGKNPEVADQIAGLHPVQQLVEIGRLMERIQIGKRVSNAPKPTEPVPNRGSASSGLSDNLSTKEWVRRRNEMRFTS